MRKLAVFASGNGSNFQAIADSINQQTLNADLVLLVCDNPNAGVIERANKMGITTCVLSPKDFDNKAAYEQQVLQQLAQHQVDFIALAGYMRLIGSTLLTAYQGRIVNIHPSLLPDFKGKDAIEQALNAGAKRIGVTIHYVDEGMDTGDIIQQEGFAITGEETQAEIEQQVHRIEHRLYPQCLQALLN